MLFCSAFSDFIKYSTLNSEHNWEDMCVHIRNQQTRTFDKHN